MTRLSSGQVGAAMRRITSHGLAEASDPAVREQLRVKFPARNDPLPAYVAKVSPIESFTGLKESLLSLQPGGAPGSGGCRPEFLISLAERMDEHEMELLEQFGMAYTSGDLPPWFYRLWLTLNTVPLFKDALQVDVRPLGIRHCLTRVFHREVVEQSKEAFRDFLEPQQLGQSRGGAAKLVHSVQGMLELHPDFVCVATDIHNCFNEESRRAVVEVISDTPGLAHLATFTGTVLAPVPGLESGGVIWGSSTMGQGQGDPVSGAFQACGLQPSLVKIDEECSEGGGMARAGADDVFSVGPPEVVFTAVENFARDIQQRCGLQLNRDKTKVYSRGL